MIIHDYVRLRICEDKEEGSREKGSREDRDLDPYEGTICIRKKRIYKQE